MLGMIWSMVEYGLQPYPQNVRPFMSNEIPRYSPSKTIPEDSIFRDIVCGFLFECPTSRQIGKGKAKAYVPVSKRSCCSFRQRGVSGSLLTTVIWEIKRTVGSDCYRTVQGEGESSTADVGAAVTALIEESRLSDKQFEFMVFRKRSEMSDAESVFYAIRNAFAHGSFEVSASARGERTYLLESEKGGVKYALMRLKERTMKQLLKIARMEAKEVKELSRRRR